MKRLLVSTLLVAIPGALAGPAALAQGTVYVSPDVPTEPDTANPPPDFLPWEIVEHQNGAPVPYALEAAVPGNPAIDALHKLDRAGHWLLSVEAPNDLAGLLASDAEPRDVIDFDAANVAASLFFDGSCVTGVVPATSNVDGLYVTGGDDGALVVSFDVPTTIGAATFQPSELVRYRHVAPGPCGWLLIGSVIDFATTLGTYFPSTTNVTGVDEMPGGWILALDVPVDLGPPGAATFTPGQIVGTDGISILPPAPLYDLQTQGVGGWPISSLVDALSCQANPGRIDSPTVQILLGKAAGPTITIFWPASCSSGAEDYGIYEGSIASIFPGGVYDHARILCTDAPPLLQETFLPAPLSSYYLVVPHNGKEEGSYGRDSSNVERPQAAGLANRCEVNQTLTSCP